MDFRRGRSPVAFRALECVEGGVPERPGDRESDLQRVTVVKGGMSAKRIRNDTASAGSPFNEV